MPHLNTDPPLDFDLFFERYKPIPNPFNPEGLYEGRLFHHYLEDSGEAHFLRGLELDKLWTLCWCEDSLILRAGYVLVDREGFFVASVARSSAHEAELFFEDVNSFRAS